MPNYTYSGYAAQADVASRLAMARQFKAELTDKITADIAKDSASRSSASLNQLLMRVDADIASYEGKRGSMRAGGVSLGRLGNRT